jgi:capsular exopolysaccharide synthesis family protein
MELREYITPLKKWWWLLAVSTIIATVSAYFATRKLPSIYQASTTLSIGRTIYEANPTGNDLGLTRQLAETYADILQQEPIRNATKIKLGLTRLPAYVALPNGQFLVIAVTDTDPERAQVVANELALQLIDLRNGPQQTDQARQAFVNQQLDDLQNDITATQKEIDKLQADLGKMFSASELAETQKQIDALQIKLTTLQTNYVSLLSNTQQGAINSLSVLSPAARPKPRLARIGWRSSCWRARVGWFWVHGHGLLAKFLDATIKTPENQPVVCSLLSLGTLPTRGWSREAAAWLSNRIPQWPMPSAPLMTNLEFAGVEKPLKTILVTSAAASEGKTTIATNLAITMAQGGKKVILLDADLRRPKVHAFLGLPNLAGVNEVYQGGLEVLEALQTWKDENLSVITAGKMAANPTELLGSEKMSQILSSLEGVADVVILDGPPFLVADAWVLSAKVDGVLLVVRPTYTHRDAVRTVMEQVNRMGARVVGVALNRIPARQAEFYGGYWYISPYHAKNRYGYVGDNGSDKAKAGSRRRKMFRGLLGGGPKPLEPLAPADKPSTPRCRWPPSWKRCR